MVTNKLEVVQSVRQPREEVRRLRREAEDDGVPKSARRANKSEGMASYALETEIHYCIWIH